MTMMREPSMIVVIVLSAALATPASAQTGNILNDNYSIMVPEKGSKLQTRAARTLACAEVPIAAWDRETRGHSEIEDRDPAKRRRSAGCFRSADGADVSEFADTRPGDRDFSRSRHTLQPTKLVSMARPAAPEAPIWVLAFNSGPPSGFALSATRRILNGTWKISGGVTR